MSGAKRSTATTETRQERQEFGNTGAAALRCFSFAAWRRFAGRHGAGADGCQSRRYFRSVASKVTAIERLTATRPGNYSTTMPQFHISAGKNP